MTLSLFPGLLFLGAIISPALLRLAVGIIGLIATKQRFKKEYKWLSAFYLITSIFIIIGMYTQAFSLLGIVLIIFEYYANKKEGVVSGERKILQILLGVVLLSLIFSGPGFLAFDMPL